MCFPHLGLGSLHTFGLLASSLAITEWNLQKMCLALDGASLTVYAFLASSGVQVPPDPSFLIVRLAVVAFQLFIDLATTAASGWSSFLDHMGGLSIGVGYILAFLPNIGSFSSAPYLIPCEVGDCLPGGVSAEFLRWVTLTALGVSVLWRRMSRKKTEIDFFSGYKTLRSVLSTPETTDAEDDLSPMSAQDVL